MASLHGVLVDAVTSLLTDKVPAVSFYYSDGVPIGLRHVSRDEAA